MLRLRWKTAPEAIIFPLGTAFGTGSSHAVFFTLNLWPKRAEKKQLAAQIAIPGLPQVCFTHHYRGGVGCNAASA